MHVSGRFRDAPRQPPWAELRYVVRCPACAGRAVVVRESATTVRTMARLVCESCGHTRSTAHDGRRWLGEVCLVVQGRCARCGRNVRRMLGHRARQPATTTGRVRCPGCGHVTSLPLDVAPVASPEAALDPWFGRPLWYQRRCAGHTLWAWNEAHLAWLRAYVGATLRERTPNVNSSLPSRLPQWIKAAKHRDAVLACLDAMTA